MYKLQVFYSGAPEPAETVQVARAADVLKKIPTLLNKHEGCEKVVVSMDATPMFAVDCEGNRLPA